MINPARMARAGARIAAGIGSIAFNGQSIAERTPVPQSFVRKKRKMELLCSRKLRSVSAIRKMTIFARPIWFDAVAGLFDLAKHGRDHVRNRC